MVLISVIYWRKLCQNHVCRKQFDYSVFDRSKTCWYG